VRWLSHPESGAVEAIEVFADRDEDPAELWLMREGDSKSMPNILDLRYGIGSLLKIKVKSWEEVPASELEWAAENKNAMNSDNSNLPKAADALPETNATDEVKA
jgi:hypothetical protein